MAVVQGTWGSGKWYDPRSYDFGASEIFAKSGNKTFYNPSVVQNVTPRSETYQVSPSINSLRPLQGPVYYGPQNTSNKVTGGSAGVAGGNVLGASVNEATNNINNTVDNYSSLLEEDFNNTLNALSGQEQGLRSQADISQKQLGNEYSSAILSLGQEQSTKQQGVEGQLSTAETEGTSAMQQARDLFRQTQQQNIAQMSGLGISSSSVSEALAERLGVETARRIAGITGSVSEVRLNAQKELARINNYYSEKKTNLEQSRAIEMSKIQQSLMQGLNQINAARNQANTDKARSRFELLNNARSAIDMINKQAQEFKNSLDRWATTKAESMQTISQNPEWLQSFMQTGQTLQQQFNPSQFVVSPTINQNQQGNYSGAWSVKPKQDEEEQGGSWDTAEAWTNLGQ